MIYFSFFTGISYGLNTTLYCAIPVVDRSDYRKYLMNALGLKNWIYWIGMFLIDYAVYCFTLLFLFGAIFIA